MSEFVFLFRATDAGRLAAMGTPEAAQQSIQTWLAWIHELEAKGHLKDRGLPLQPTGKVVSGKDNVITDGPYAESKDLLLGFIIIQARDVDEAAQIAGGCPIVAGGGSVEIRPIGAVST